MDRRHSNIDLILIVFKINREKTKNIEVQWCEQGCKESWEVRHKKGRNVTW